MPEIKFTRGDAGCYLDGHFGWHNTYRVVELAMEHGFVLPHRDEDARLLDAYREQRETVTHEGVEVDVFEAVAGRGGLADEATEYLRSITAEGLDWVWDCGELCLMEVDDDGEPLL